MSTVEAAALLFGSDDNIRPDLFSVIGNEETDMTPPARLAVHEYGQHESASYPSDMGQDASSLFTEDILKGTQPFEQDPWSQYPSQPYVPVYSSYDHYKPTVNITPTCTSQPLAASADSQTTYKLYNPMTCSVSQSYLLFAHAAPPKPASPSIPPPPAQVPPAMSAASYHPQKLNAYGPPLPPLKVPKCAPSQIPPVPPVPTVPPTSSPPSNSTQYGSLFSNVAQPPVSHPPPQVQVTHQLTGALGVTSPPKLLQQLPQLTIGNHYTQHSLSQAGTHTSLLAAPPIHTNPPTPPQNSYEQELLDKAPTPKQGLSSSFVDIIQCVISPATKTYPLPSHSESCAYISDDMPWVNWKVCRQIPRQHPLLCMPFEIPTCFHFLQKQHLLVLFTHSQAMHDLASPAPNPYALAKNAVALMQPKYHDHSGSNGSLHSTASMPMGIPTQCKVNKLVPKPHPGEPSPYNVVSAYSQELLISSTFCPPYAPSPSLLGSNDPLGHTSSQTPVISFGFGGKMVTCFYSSPDLIIGYDVALSSHHLTDVCACMLHKLLSEFVLEPSAAAYPGPLFFDPGTPISIVHTGVSSHVKMKKACIVKYLEDHIEELTCVTIYMSDGTEKQPTEGKLILVKLLKIMVENDGALSGSAHIDSAVRMTLLPRIAASEGADISTPGFASCIPNALGTIPGLNGGHPITITAYAYLLDVMVSWNTRDPPMRDMQKVDSVWNNKMAGGNHTHPMYMVHNTSTSINKWSSTTSGNHWDLGKLGAFGTGLSPPASWGTFKSSWKIGGLWYGPATTSLLGNI
ncbi:hypothetical protein BDR06DRAFT_972634 [Suillus hirtellus]|nr:hypothetical protein BDR06DRAFT_972634 [Suillus hirtellus]